MLPAATGYGWNPNSQRYIDLETGRFISSSVVRDALESLTQNSQANMRALSEQLLNGDITLAQWQRGMMDNIKVAHVAAGAAGGGGWGNMSQGDWGAVGQLVREQYDFLRNFARQIEDGTQALDGRVLVRSDMYGEAARGTFEEIHRRGMIAAGYDLARRVLGSSDHCDDCLDYAAEGWMPAEDVPPIGDSVCLTRCNCSIEYKSSTEEGEEL